MDRYELAIRYRLSGLGIGRKIFHGRLQRNLGFVLPAQPGQGLAQAGISLEQFFLGSVFGFQKIQGFLDGGHGLVQIAFFNIELAQGLLDPAVAVKTRIHGQGLFQMLSGFIVQPLGQFGPGLFQQAFRGLGIAGKLPPEFIQDFISLVKPTQFQIIPAQV